MSSLVIAIIAVGGLGGVVAIYFIVKAFKDSGKYKTLYHQAVEQLVENEIQHRKEMEHTRQRMKTLEKQDAIIKKIDEGHYTAGDLNRIRSGLLPKENNK